MAKLSIAKKLANKAKQVGADAIKFQIYIAQDLATKKAKSKLSKKMIKIKICLKC